VWPQLGGYSVVYPYAEPISQNDKSTCAGIARIADARGAAANFERVIEQVKMLREFLFCDFKIFKGDISPLNFLSSIF